MKPVEKLSICIQESSILNTLAGIWGGGIVVLALLDIFLNYLEWTSIGALQRLVNVSQDDGLVNWFSSMQLFCIALVLWGIFAVLLTQKQFLKRIVLWGWGFIASFFSYLALDDGSRLHERIGTAVEETFKNGSGSGGGFFSELVKSFPSFHWQLIFVPTLVCIGFFVMWFMWKNLNTREQKILLFLGLSLYGCSVVLDFIEGVESIYINLAASLEVKTYVISHLSILIEECSEMFGNTFIMLAFLKQLTSLAGNWSVRVISSAFPESAKASAGVEESLSFE